jgi:hypothetical protein
MSASNLTELDKSIVRMARDRLILLHGWLRESSPPVTPRFACDILVEAIRCQQILLGEGTKKDIDWLLDRDGVEKPDHEAVRGAWLLCPACQKREEEAKKPKTLIPGTWAKVVETSRKAADEAMLSSEGLKEWIKVGMKVVVLSSANHGKSGIVRAISNGKARIDNGDPLNPDLSSNGYTWSEWVKSSEIDCLCECGHSLDKHDSDRGCTEIIEVSGCRLALCPCARSPK